MTIPAAVMRWSPEPVRASPAPPGSVSFRGGLPGGWSADRFLGPYRRRTVGYELSALPLVVDQRAGGFMASGVSGAGSVGGGSTSELARR